MGANTQIEWCDHSLSPWWGCTKVSPGCAHCYAEGLDARWHAGAHWGKGASRLKQPNFERNALDLDRKAGRRGRRETVFPSMCDPFDAEVDVEWLAELLGVIKDTQNLIWILLTKRPENWRDRLAEVVRMKVSHGDVGFLQCTGAAMAALWLNGAPPANVWMMTSVEDQPRADLRVPPLLQIPAVVRGLSIEPLLGAVTLPLTKQMPIHDPEFGDQDEYYELNCGIHWVICGGESGPGARPMHPNWARQIRAQCAEAGVAFFFKQWGEWSPAMQIGDRVEIISEHRCPKNPEWFTCPTGELLARVGKKAAGSLLDGVEHKAFPGVKP